MVNRIERGMKMLNSQRNTEAMRRRILNAANKHFNSKGNNAVFEHGHWWICRKDGSQYDVVDAEGIGTIDGFDFEMVTYPEE